MASNIPTPTANVEQIEKVHGFTATGYEALTGNQDFFTLRTLVPILANGQDVSADFPGAFSTAVLVGDATTQLNLDVLVETISLRAQPVIMSLASVTRETLSSITDLPAEADDGDGFDTVYTLRFSVEHADAWEDGTLLLQALDAAVGNFVWNNPSATPANNVAVTRSATMPVA